MSIDTRSTLSPTLRQWRCADSVKQCQGISTLPTLPTLDTSDTSDTPDTPDTPDTLDTGLSIADILHLSSPLRPAQALPLPPPVLHPVLLPPPLLLPPLSQVLQLLRLPLLTVALREHRRARRARTRP